MERTDLLLIVILLIFIGTIYFSNNKNENFNNKNCVCSYDQLTAAGGCKSSQSSDNIYAKCVDKNIVIPQRYLGREPGHISGYSTYNTEKHSPIYEIGEIDLFNNPRIPHGYNSSGKITNNDYNRNVSA